MWRAGAPRRTSPAFVAPPWSPRLVGGEVTVDGVQDRAPTRFEPEPAVVGVYRNVVRFEGGLIRSE